MRKFKCIKSYESGEWLTKGKIYTEDNGRFEYDDGWTSNWWDYNSSHFDKNDAMSNYLEEIIDEREGKKMEKIIKPTLDSDTMIEKLDEYCCERSCDDCVFKGGDDDFVNMTDEELLSSYNLAFGNHQSKVVNNSESTFTITTSDTTTILTDGTHTTTINRYYTDKHDDMIALEEVVKKYKSEIDETPKEKHLFDDEINCDYGIVGTPTILTDSVGRKLFVGDVVKVYNKDGSCDGFIDLVCRDDDYGDFIMGCGYATRNNSKKEYNYLKEMSYEDISNYNKIWNSCLVIK